MKILNHRIQEIDGFSFDFEPTKNYWHRNNPLYLIIHYTADNSLTNVVNFFKKRLTKGNASAHLVIDRDGSVIQMVDFNKRAWHAGISSWGQLKNLNNYSIGIELVNSGQLTQKANGQWVNWKKDLIPEDEVVMGIHKNDHSKQQFGWQEYPPQQLKSLELVAQLLHNKYDFEDILGHDDISPGRKIDPGPAFNMVSFKSKIIGRENH